MHIMLMLFLICSIIKANPCDSIERELIKKTAEIEVLVEFHNGHTAQIQENETEKLIRTIFECIGSLALVIGGIVTGKRIGKNGIQNKITSRT